MEEVVDRCRFPITFHRQEKEKPGADDLAFGRRDVRRSCFAGLFWDGLYL
jgi:hypothetical protein